MNWLNLDSGSSALTCVCAQRGVDRFYIFHFASSRPRGFRWGIWANELPSTSSAVLTLASQPSFPLQVSLLALVPAGEILINPFPGSTLQNLSREHQERTRRKAQEGMTGKPKDAWPNLETHKEMEGLPAVVLGPLPSAQGGKEVRNYFTITGGILTCYLKETVNSQLRSYLWP